MGIRIVLVLVIVVVVMVVAEGRMSRGTIVLNILLLFLLQQLVIEIVLCIRLPNVRLLTVYSTMSLPGIISGTLRHVSIHCG